MGGDWTEDLKPADLVLAPAACYPIYPIAAERGVVPDEGYIFDVAADCFRHEPSRHVDRFQSFRMREYVRIGTPRQIQEFREPWIARAQALADVIGLSYTVDVANDPFFGRVGAMMANQQREDALKFELAGAGAFGRKPHCLHELQLSQGTFRRSLGPAQCQAGEVLHTGCVAFGMDRLGGGAVRHPWRQNCGMAGQRAGGADSLGGVAGIHRDGGARHVARRIRSSGTTTAFATSSTSTSRFSAARAAILPRCSSVHAWQSSRSP